MKTEGPKVIFQIEIKCGRRKVEEVINLMGYDSGFVVVNRGLSGGHSIDEISLESYSQNHISLSYRRDGSKVDLQLTRFYGHPSTS